MSASSGNTYAADMHAYLERHPAKTYCVVERVVESTGRSGCARLAAGERLHAAGEVARAVDALEGAVNLPAQDLQTQLMDPEYARVWLLFGTTHAECDDVRNMQALRVSPHRHRARGPGGKHNAACTRAAAALALAVSYINELDAARATAHLRRWLALYHTVLGEAEAANEDACGMSEEVDGGEEATPTTRCRYSCCLHCGT